MKSENKKRNKKANIPFRRKIGAIYANLILGVKILFVVFICIFFFTNYLKPLKTQFKLYLYDLAGDVGFKLENVLIEGQKFSDLGDIVSSLNADHDTPIFLLDLKTIKAQIENNNWIKEVVVIKRNLPNELYIYILERIPIAIWQTKGEVFLIDTEGKKITKKIEDFAHLLHVVGIDANIYAKQLLEELGKYPNIKSRILSAVRFGNRRWNLNLEQNITVKLPEANMDKALKYISEMDKKKLLFNHNYKSLDLRDNNKYYVEKY